jgi:hypothetical protein
MKYERPKVYMVEIYKGAWRIENAKRDILVSGLFGLNKDAAERYVTSYISSFSDWTYEIIEMKVKPNKGDLK